MTDGGYTKEQAVGMHIARADEERLKFARKILVARSPQDAAAMLKERAKRHADTMDDLHQIEITDLKEEHDRRVTELLAANNAEVERRREAERQAEINALAADLWRARARLLSEERKAIAIEIDRLHERGCVGRLSQ